MASAALADDPSEVSNVGRFDFDALPQESPLAWNLDNYTYPPGALTIEGVGRGNNGLRVGKADGSQVGRCTLTLRASTHGWDPSDTGATHVVSARFCARYTGAAMLGVSSSGGGAIVDLGGGALKVRQREGGEDQTADETAAVQAALQGKWSAADLHTYTLQWKTTGERGNLPFVLLVDGMLVKRFTGHDRPLGFNSTLEISFESGEGTGLVDFVEWKLNDGKVKPVQPFLVAKGIRQLFLDQDGIEKIEGLRVVVNQPARHPENPVIRGDRPWEKGGVSVYGTALYDESMGLFRLWYLCFPGPPGKHPLAYATSRDGVHWEKPALGRVDFEGSRENNLVDVGSNPEGVSVLYDPRDSDPRRRYKAFFWDNGGMWVAFSPDGIAWQNHGPVLPQGSDTTQAVVFDTRLSKYVAFGRFEFGRFVARTESEDFLHWSEPKVVLSTDPRDGPDAQVYGMPTDLYEGLYLGMFWMYRQGTDGRIDTQLAVSREGVRWRRVAGRQTFLPNAPEGAWDDGMSRVVGRYIVRGDTLYLYYSMVNGPHRGPKYPNPVRRFLPAIGLVTLRRDGFVSLDAGGKEGSVLTKPFVCPGGRLHLNADARGGQVHVTVCEVGGKPLHGYEYSKPVEGDRLRTSVEWRRGDMNKLRGQTIRLRFTLKGAKLFSYWFE